MCVIMSFPITMSSKGFKLVNKLLFILLHTSYHNCYISSGNILFMLCTIHKYDKKMYILLFMGWRCYVHMMCLILMLNPPHLKPMNLLVKITTFPKLHLKNWLRLL